MPAEHLHVIITGILTLVFCSGLGVGVRHFSESFDSISNRVVSAVFEAIGFMLFMYGLIGATALFAYGAHYVVALFL